MAHTVEPTSRGFRYRFPRIGMSDVDPPSPEAPAVIPIGPVLEEVIAEAAAAEASGLASSSPSTLDLYDLERDLETACCDVSERDARSKLYPVVLALAGQAVAFAKHLHEQETDDA